MNQYLKIKNKKNLSSSITKVNATKRTPATVWAKQFYQTTMFTSGNTTPAKEMTWACTFTPRAFVTLADGLVEKDTAVALFSILMDLVTKVHFLLLCFTR